METEEKMTMQEQYQYLRRMKRRYQKASRQERSRTLDGMEAYTGLHRNLIRSTAKNLARWGKKLAKISVALLLGKKENTVRQRLREWCYDAKDKRGRHRVDLDVKTCFLLTDPSRAQRLWLAVATLWLLMSGGCGGQLARSGTQNPDEPSANGVAKVPR